MNLATLIRSAGAGISLAFLYPSGCAVAESGHPEAHVHGVAELTLALEQGDLEIMFESPASSVLGFEHKAVGRAQLEAVAEAESSLRAPAGLFRFSGTLCELRDTAVDMSSVRGNTVAERVGHGNHEAGDHAHEEGDSHSDISAHYRYRCADGGQLRTLQVGSNGLPFGLDAIKVMWVTDHGQGATVLNAENQVVELR